MAGDAHRNARLQRPSPSHATPSSALRIALLALALAFGFLGLRGLIDPDEGRYTNVALHMLDSGDWVHPHRSDAVGHWTKPPLTYWAIAASLRLFGNHAWAARLPAALAYLLCVWLAWRIARRLAPGGEATAALAFATMLWPFVASQIITTDFLVAAWQGVAMWAFVEARFGASRRPGAWIALMWLAFALAFLVKGPPGLLALPAIAALALLAPGPREARAFRLWSLPLFLLVAAPWFVVVVRDQPALLGYFLGQEVVNRVASDTFNRHGEWYGWLVVYAPTLLLGSLPWTGSLLRGLRGLPARVTAWRTRAGRIDDAPALLLALWIALPLLVFCLARSRLPLYVLPLFLPLAVSVARLRTARATPLPSWWAIALWTALLLGAKVVTARIDHEDDARRWAQAIRERTASLRVGEVVFVEDTPRYGLHLELGAEVERVSLDPLPQPRPIDSPYDRTFADALRAQASHTQRMHAGATVWIVKRKYWPRLRAQADAAGERVDILGTPYRDRIIVRISH